MPKKKKKKKKSSTSKQLYADYRASGAELKAKPRGFNKILNIDSENRFSQKKVLQRKLWGTLWVGLKIF